MSVHVHFCLFALGIVELHWLMFLYILKQTQPGAVLNVSTKAAQNFSARSNLVLFHLPVHRFLALSLEKSRKW